MCMSAYLCLSVSGNGKCSAVAQLPTLELCNHSYYKFAISVVFQVFKSFACLLGSIATICPPYKQAKSMKTFNIYLIKSVANFKIFLLAGGALAGAWGAYIA